MRSLSSVPTGHHGFRDANHHQRYTTTRSICQHAVSCSNGSHNGGDGNCVAAGPARQGITTRRGNLRGQRRLLTGNHNGGTGPAVASGVCSTGLHDGGTGTCIASGTCSTGYHDGARDMRGHRSLLNRLPRWRRGNLHGQRDAARPDTTTTAGNLHGQRTCSTDTTTAERGHAWPAGPVRPVPQWRDRDVRGQRNLLSRYHDGGTGTCRVSGSCSKSVLHGGGEPALSAEHARRLHIAPEHVRQLLWWRHGKLHTLQKATAATDSFFSGSTASSLRRAPTTRQRRDNHAEQK